MGTLGLELQAVWPEVSASFSSVFLRRAFSWWMSVPIEVGGRALSGGGCWVPDDTRCLACLSSLLQSAGWAERALGLSGRRVGWA